VNRGCAIFKVAARIRARRERASCLRMAFCRGIPVTIAKKSAQKPATEPVSKRAITNRRVLNEAYDYAKPSSFSRGMRVELGGGAVMLLISGTASIDEHGASVHVGDFRAQCRRTFQNITALLASESATWKDIVRTTCYLRDIDRDYAQFNEERTAFYKEQGLEPLPASTGVQAKLCRPELLVEIEAIAMFREVPEE
jgi:2-iminobutanoate/2-iminopropanoate deaminase